VAAVAVTLLVVGVSGSIARPWRLPAWIFPVVAAALALAIGALAPSDAWEATHPLVEPIAFLLLAVPLAVLLDDLGVFAAAWLAAGRHLCAGMWVVSAVAVAVLNLDAGTLVLHLGLPTLAAVALGYAGWRLAFRHRAPRPVAPANEERVSRRALVIGGVVIAALLAGFLPGRLLGIEPWMVVAVVDVALIGMTRTVPWRSITWGTAAVAAGLAIVAAAAAQRVGVASWLLADGTWGQALRGAAAANMLNNLPAFLVALPHVSGTGHVLALLFGVNVGATILVTGSLAGLLWLDAARRHGLPVGGREYARVGLVAGVPALIAGVAVLALV